MPESQKRKYKENPLRRKYGHHVHTKKASPLSVNQIKKKLRDTNRLLKKDLNAQKRTELERLVQSLEEQIKQTENEKRYTKYQERYKYVRFVEAKKSQRRLKHAEKEGDQEAIQKFQLNALYTKFYPMDCKYVALYPSEELKPESKTWKRRNEILERIKELHEQGKLSDGYSWTLKSQEEDSDTESEPEEAKDDEQDDFFLI
jgi:hypothetical protein